MSDPFLYRVKAAQRDLIAECRLVKLGKRLTAALFGEDSLGWAPYLALWLALASGAALGAFAYRLFGAASLWGGALAMALLGALSLKLRLRPVEGAA